jgi:hypothetical protein
MALAVCVNANAQERVNGVKYIFNNSTPNIKQITKWSYDDRTEQWDSDNSHSTTLSIKTFIYNNETHYVLCLQYLTGKYKYPTIKEGWHSWVQYYYALISENDYKVITNSNEGFYTFKFYGEDTSDTYHHNSIIREILFQNNEEFLQTNGLEVSILFYKDVVRFNTSKDGYWKYDDEVKELKNRYYEVSKAEWSKLKIN